jgi:hypothetical protein
MYHGNGGERGSIGKRGSRDPEILLTGEFKNDRSYYEP